MSSAQDEKMNGKRGGGGGGGGVSGGAKQPHVGEDEIADLVGQLEKYAELKTGQGNRGEGFGGSNNVNKASAGGKKVGDNVRNYNYNPPPSWLKRKCNACPITV